MFSKRELAKSMLEVVEPVICRIVRRKLGTTLRHDDGRAQNLDAMDVLGDIRLKLIRKQTEAAAITDWQSYAAMVAYNACADYLRAKYPQRTRLKNALCRLLEKSDGYYTAEIASGETVCGYATQRNVRPDSSRIDELRKDPWKLPRRVLTSESLDSITPSALRRIVDAVLDHVSSPIPVDD